MFSMHNLMSIVGVLVIFCVVLHQGLAVNSHIPLDASLDGAWQEFKEFHLKVYETVAQEVMRRAIWERNVRAIQKHNFEHDLGKHTYRQGMNHLGDLSHEEINAKMNGYKVRHTESKGDSFMRPENVAYPNSVDWRTQGYVTPVKDQKDCGSCWAFSATGSLEGQHFRKTGQLRSLSEQNLVDCSGKYGNQGCNGGLMDQAFTYIKENKGIDTEISYPYEAIDSDCRFKRSNVGATDEGFTDIGKGNETDLLAAVATVGPISVAIDASHNSFHFYKSGVYNEKACSSTLLDHGVLAVGYGTENGKKYWLVKNSWGPKWGSHGYIMMSRDANNQCGIATAASYPKV